MLSADQVQRIRRQLSRQGYAVIPGFIDSEGLAILHEVSSCPPLERGAGSVRCCNYSTQYLECF